jgi:collagenase-like PrtC family protease
MKLCISSQWDDVFLNECAAHHVGEIYCSLQMGVIGSARPAVCLPESTIEEAANHIKRVHELGMEFNYIANAPCLGNLEYSYEGRKNLREYFQLIDGLGVDTITLAIPYLVELVKKEFPHLKIKVSEIANVGTAQRARFYEELGADIITLEIVHNRDFRALESIGRAVSPRVELELVVNPACIFHCPYHDYHNNIVGHSSQAGHPLKGYYIDYCMMKCIPQKLIHPEEIIKAPWIRPEDLHEYENTGIRRFKISNRVGPKKLGLNCLKAYSNRQCDNLAQLVSPLSLEIEEPPGASKPAGFSEKEWQQVVRIWAVPSPAVHIDNRKLDGFIEYFKKGSCYGQCDAGCRYCSETAARVIDIDSEEVEKYVHLVDGLLHPLMTLNHKKEDILTMEWQQDLKDTFERIMQETPEIFREVARTAVGTQAEANARERGARTVTQQDLVKSFMSETPGAFKNDMITSLKRERLDTEI